MAIFVPKSRVHPFGRMSIFPLFELYVFIPQKSVFFFQNIIKDIFLAYVAQKKKVGTMAVFDPKPRVNCFGKISIFRLFELRVFFAQKGVFSLQNMIKDIFLGYIAQKKSWKKLPFLNQSHGKMSIFRLFRLLVFIAQKSVFFVLEYHKRHFPGLYCLKRKSWKNGHFWTKTMG